jgi:predicted porin
MKKITSSFAAACLSLAGASALAQSQLTVYGVAAVEMVRVNNVNSGTSIDTLSKLDNSQVSTSRLGFRGSEDLGGGLSAVFGLEAPISLDTGGSNARFWNRGTYAGLKSNLGTLTLGRQWNVNDDVMGKFFVFGGYSAFRFTEFGYISDLVDNAVKYVSPTFGGAQVRLLVGAGEGSTGRTTEAAFTYGSGPLDLAFSVREARNLGATKSDKLSSAGVSYDFGVVRLHGGYSSASPAASGLPDAKAWDVGVASTLASVWVVTFDYVSRDQQGTDNDSKFLRLAADYFLSKRTSIMLNWVKLDNKGTAKERFYGNGAAGLGQTVYSLGLRQTF